MLIGLVKPQPLERRGIHGQRTHASPEMLPNSLQGSIDLGICPKTQLPGEKNGKGITRRTEACFLGCMDAYSKNYHE